MKRLILFVLVAILIPCTVYASVLFQDSFDSSSDWTVTQPTGSDSHCYPSTSCGVPGGWTGYVNGACLCDGISGEPGNNNFYINQYAGYPLETNACRGGSGKCVTFWEESCVTSF